MAKTKKQYSPEFKLKAVIEILKGEKTVTQIAGEFGAHPLALADWKKQFFKTGAQILPDEERPRE